MLDAYIIEELKKQEEERIRKEDERRPRLEIPLDYHRERFEEPLGDSREEDRGYIQIQLKNYFS